MLPSVLCILQLHLHTCALHGLSHDPQCSLQRHLELKQLLALDPERSPVPALPRLLGQRWKEAGVTRQCCLCRLGGIGPRRKAPRDVQELPHAQHKWLQRNVRLGCSAQGFAVGQQSLQDWVLEWQATKLRHKLGLLRGWQRFNLGA